MKKGTIFTRKGIQRSCGVKNTGVFTPPTSADNELARKGLAVAGSLRRRACPPADKHSGRGPPETSSAKRDAGYGGRGRSAASRRLAERSPAAAELPATARMPIKNNIGRGAAGKLCLAEHISVEVVIEGGAAGRGVEKIGGAGDEGAEALQSLCGVIAAAGKKGNRGRIRDI